MVHENCIQGMITKKLSGRIQKAKEEVKNVVYLDC